jgi:hypothetical protein
MSRIVARVATVVLLIIAMVVIGQRSVTAEAVTPPQDGYGFSGPAFIFSVRDVNTADQDNEQDNFGALLTSDWQPKVAAGCWQGRPPPLRDARILDEVG